jgi:hypothetical protein
MHTSDLVTTGCVSLVMLVMTQVVRSSSISIITSVRIIGVNSFTIKTLLSSSSVGSTEWRRMCPVAMLINSIELRAVGFKIKEVLPPAFEGAARVNTRGTGL